MSDILRMLQASIGSAYSIERELGGGGMSRVFVATETALGRRVVVKVLMPELAEGLSADRFAREIRLAAALQDPHIVPVLSAGEAGGLPYYTMPYVEGESLRARLLRGAPPVGEALGILRDVALALEYAHARGVVHRDIKPENVLLAGRTAVVADFGIAKAVSAARTTVPGASGGTLTSIGQSLGTPAYMAPEQAAGDPVDHRADLYAWGVMAYELLAGQHPFADKATAAQLMAAHVTEQPSPLADRKPGLPPPVAAIVMQCLAKDPDARPQNASDVVHGLDAINSPLDAQLTPTGARTARTLNPTGDGAAVPRRSLGPAAVGGTVLLAAAILWIVRGPGRSTIEATPAGSPAPVATTARSIAVLPFENLGDSADAYFADGITDAVRGKLTSLRDLKVIARGSSVLYQGTKKSPADISRELGVRYLLTGTVRFAAAGTAKRVLVSPELVEVGTNGQPQSVWQQPFDAEVKDVFKVQGDIAGKVAEAMQLALGGAAQAELAKAPTQDPAAYDFYLRAAAAWNYGASTDLASLRRAAAFYEQAVARDSQMVAAWADLARVRNMAYSNSPARTRADAALVKRTAERAMALDPNGTLARSAMSLYLSTVENDNAGALGVLEPALRAAPGDANLRIAAAKVKRAIGRLEESVKDYQKAVELDPRSARAWDGLALELVRLRRCQEARAAMERALTMTPNSLTLQQDAVIVEVCMGDLAGARRVVEHAKSQVAAAPLAAFLAMYWDMGWVLGPDDERLLLTLGPDAFDGDRSVWAIVRAQQYGYRGDTALARAWGDSASRYFAAGVRRSPDEAQQRAIHGLALAYAGRHAEAVAESERATKMMPIARNNDDGSYFLYLLARVYLMVGRQDDALTALETLIRDATYNFTPGWLRIDPSWKSLKGNPRFEKLIATT